MEYSRSRPEESAFLLKTSHEIASSAHDIVQAAVHQEIKKISLSADCILSTEIQRNALLIKKNGEVAFVMNIKLSKPESLKAGLSISIE